MHWVTPDFGFYDWPEPKIESYRKVRRRIREVESQTPYEEKHKKLVWRGARGNSFRQTFLNVTEGVDWADTHDIEWHNPEMREKYLLSMSEHCRYQYVAHISGNSWSGQGKYAHNCESVFVTHETALKWTEIFTAAIEVDGEGQNVVLLHDDWDDLASTIDNLMHHQPEKARRIAKNAKDTFQDRYLTPAAEACYWRELFRQWSTISFEPNLYKEDNKTWRGTPFESVALLQKTEWEAY